MKIFLSIFVFLFITITAQENNKIIVVGDSLIGRIENGNSIREVIGNVVMTQANVKITCNRAIQNISKNNAILIGNVVATQDTITVVTEKGYYYGNLKYIYSDTLLTLEDGHVVLTADTGYYFFDEKRAVFNSDVQLVDSLNILNADKLTYFNELGKAIAVGDVDITDESSVISCDSLEHFREMNISNAFRNVVIKNSEQELVIYGDQLFNDGENNYSKIIGKPLLVKIDSSENNKFDTLFIAANKFESVKDSVSKLIATDSVKIIRGDLLSINNFSVLYKEENKLVTYRREDDSSSPVLWYDNSQVIGDTIKIFITKEKLDSIEISEKAIIISQNEKFDMRFDQISGNNILLRFNNNSLIKTEVNGEVLSIYYLYEDEKPNGLMKSSSNRAVMKFNENRLTGVSMYGSVESEYHPESLINGNEIDFTLPSFILVNNKPEKSKLTQRSKKR